MNDAPPPRFPHLIGKGIMYQSEPLSKHAILLGELALLVAKLRDDADWPTYGEATRRRIADELERLIKKATEPHD